MIVEHNYFIYKITNTCNSKVYIGQIWVSIARRWSSHVSDSRRGVDSHLYRAFRKYGSDAFRVTIIANAFTLEGLNALETTLILQYNSFIKGYNSTTGGCCHTQISDETKEKLRNCNLGKKTSVETRLKMSLSAKGNQRGLGHKQSPEARRKISKSLVGNQRRKGIPHSPGTRKKMSENSKGSRGLIYTPLGVFKNCRQAGKILNLAHGTITTRCNNTKRFADWYFEKPPVRGVRSR